MLLAASAVLVLAGTLSAKKAVPQGSPELARKYYRQFATTLAFRDPESILTSTLDDLLGYTGYGGLKAVDLQKLDSDVLMDPSQLGKPCAAAEVACRSAVSDPVAFQATFRQRRLKRGDILVSRFLAPKIANANDPPATRPLGWRKLVRLRVRAGSLAASKGIETAIVLFNFFTGPNVKPFGSSSESVNTQVMLLPSRKHFETEEDVDAIYWLDYGPLSGGGTLSLQLDASFDAAELQASAGGTQPYYVPDGCVACHGEHPQRSLLNYLDTDHWFDRLENDFSRVRDEGLSVLFDAGTNDPTTRQFGRAFAAIRQFNKEAEQQVKMAQPQSFHRLANRKWLDLHARSPASVPPIRRSLSRALPWDSASTDDVELLGKLNRYCFRCHGTIRFNVFDKAYVRNNAPFIQARLKPVEAQLEADPHFGMPPDRVLDASEIDRMRELLGKLGISR